eukprot:4911735-Prymnesium_polylepis.1
MSSVLAVAVAVSTPHLYRPPRPRPLQPAVHVRRGEVTEAQDGDVAQLVTRADDPVAREFRQASCARLELKPGEGRLGIGAPQLALAHGAAEAWVT